MTNGHRGPLGAAAPGVLVSAVRHARYHAMVANRTGDARGVNTVEDPGIDVDPIYVHVLEASPELDCWLRVHLENQGRLPVTVRGVELPMHGPGTMNGIRAGELSPSGVPPQTADAAGPPAVGAVYRPDHQLEPQQGLELRMAL